MTGEKGDRGLAIYGKTSVVDLKLFILDQYADPDSLTVLLIE